MEGTGEPFTRNSSMTGISSLGPSSTSARPQSMGVYRRRIQQSNLLNTSSLVAESEEARAKHRKDPWQRASYWITIFCASLGIVGSVLLCYFDLKALPDVGNLCLILEDNFDTLDTSVWRREVQVGGFGNNEFDWTTADSENSFTDSGVLYIVPTLTEDTLGRDAVFDGYNLTLPDCTAANFTSCTITSNASTGVILPPVRSARLTTQLSRNIQFGRVEIRARMPRGDWLWPALWMMPVNETYGPWPASGEIDIIEARGNSPEDYSFQPRNYVSSALNWGPLVTLNRFFKTRGYAFERHASYDKDFHTFVLEWTQDFMWVYVDSRITRTLDLRFNFPFFERGEFPKTIINGTEEIVLKNPWEGRGNAAPFDHPFYLIMNVAVGGTNGWFPDGVGNKPWLDQSTNAMRDFANAKDRWFPTWPTDVKERALAVDYVKMWQKCDAPA
ncbi:Concanavalin A-like lectin/glucanase domain superfamily protein [Pleurotus pulmonarius]|nr:hypothetical protein EYR36_009803 [Pleurotus pulmonarius]